MKQRPLGAVAFAILVTCLPGCAGTPGPTVPIPLADSLARRAPSKAAVAEILVTNYDAGLPVTAVEFASGVQGNVAPMRRFEVTASTFGLRPDGTYWSGPYYATSSPYDPGLLERHSANGTVIKKFVGTATDPIEEVSVAPNGDLLISAWERYTDDGYACGIIEGHLSLYSAARAFKKTRTIDAGQLCTDVVYTDGKGHVVIGYDQDDYFYSIDTTAISVLDAASTSADYPAYRITFNFPYTTIQEIATDTHGNIFALVNNELLRYAAGKTSARYVLKGVPVTSFALDSKNDLYAVVGTYIEEFAPGKTYPFRVIGGPASGLINPGSISVAD